MDDKQRKKVITKVRNSIIAAAREAEVLKIKTNRLAQRAGEKWEESKPLQEKAARNIREVAQEIIAFSKSVAQGVKEGVREVRARGAKAK